jgi:hypothetical protein
VQQVAHPTSLLICCSAISNTNRLQYQER